MALLKKMTIECNWCTFFCVCLCYDKKVMHGRRKAKRYSISKTRFGYPKYIIRKYHESKLVFLYVSMSRISQVIVSDITFRISFRISEKLFGFVMKFRLMENVKTKNTLPGEQNAYNHNIH